MAAWSSACGLRGTGSHSVASAERGGHKSASSSAVQHRVALRRGGMLGRLHVPSYALKRRSSGVLAVNRRAPTPLVCDEQCGSCVPQRQGQPGLLQRVRRCSRRVSSKQRLQRSLKRSHAPVQLVDAALSLLHYCVGRGSRAGGQHARRHARPRAYFARLLSLSSLQNQRVIYDVAAGVHCSRRWHSSSVTLSSGG